jgi:uncharacterized protein YcbK (DUF882 family)
MDGRASVIGRRGLILGAAAALAGCGARLEPLPSPWRPGSRLDALVPRLDAHLDITNANTGERRVLRFASQGRTDRRALRELDWIFRDWRAGQAPEIDPRLYWALAALSQEARQAGHSGRVTLLSGYRTRRTNAALQRAGAGAASNSYHIRRRAADIRLEGVEMAALAERAEWLGIGGVGRYPSQNFVHIDSGDPRSWTA